MPVARWSRLAVDTVELWQSDWNVKVSLRVVRLESRDS